MSQPPHQTINVSNVGIGTGGGQYPPQSAHAQNQASQGESNFADGSGHIFSMYMEMAIEEDKKMVENWKADADGILIFTGLFSAAVATLISVTIQDIRPNPQDTSNFYLANIYQTAIDPNRSNISSSLPSSPPPFSPPNYAIWVNALWFLSLVVSLTCALLATLLQQWARRYLRVTQPRYSLHKRARIRAFFFEGVEKDRLSWVVDALPMLLHVSLSLFFAGLMVFLSNVDLTIFKLVLSLVCACTAVYGCITLIPIFRHGSPYSTPLTSLAWPIVIRISYVTFRVIRRLTRLGYFSGETNYRFDDLAECYGEFLVQGMQKTAEETALNSPPEIDARAFLWTFDSLDEDHELERFFSGLPGFRSSKVVKDPLPSLTIEQKWKLSEAIIGSLDRTFSSDLLPAVVKKRRAVICAKAIDPAHNHMAFKVLDTILSHYQYSGLLATQILQIVGGWGNNGDEKTILVARATVSVVVARSQRHDDAWFILASNELGVPESVLRDYAAHGDNLSFAILIHITRQQFRHLWKGSWPYHTFSKVIMTASRFNIQDTSPELQHGFCALWNQIVLKAQNNDDSATAWYLLRLIRNVYVGLHKDTDSAPTRFSPPTPEWDDILRDPSSYPVCNVAGHIHDNSASIAPHHNTAPVPPPLASPNLPSSSVPTPLHIDDNSTPHINDVSVPTPLSRAVLHPDAPQIPASPVSPDLPSSSIPTPLHVDENPMDVPPLDNNTSVPASFHITRQTATENLHIPATSPDPAAAGGTRDIGTSTNTTPPTTRTFSTSPVLPNDAVDLQQRAGLLASPSALDSQPPTSPNPVLDIMLSTESHCSILGTTATGTSLGPSSAPDLGAAAEDEGSQRADLHMERDRLDTPVNRAMHTNTMATLDLPLWSPPLSLISDAAMRGPSGRGPDAEHTGDRPAHSSQGQSDIVS